MNKYLLALYLLFLMIILASCENSYNPGGGDNNGNNYGFTEECSITDLSSSITYGTTPLDLVLTVDQESATIEIETYDVLRQDPGEYPEINVKIGYGPQGSAPETNCWQWKEASYLRDNGNSDIYGATIQIDTTGIYSYCFKATNNDIAWVVSAVREVTINN